MSGYWRCKECVGTEISYVGKIESRDLDKYGLPAGGTCDVKEHYYRCDICGERKYLLSDLAVHVEREE